jgi:hypothetical protein
MKELISLVCSSEVVGVISSEQDFSCASRIELRILYVTPKGMGHLLSLSHKSSFGRQTICFHPHNVLGKIKFN